jgi:hypothetical protein
LSALAQADLGIAIGAGTDVAIETADLVLMRSDPLDVPTALRIGRGTLRKMRQNLGWAIGYNTIALPIAAGVFEPAFGLVLRPEIAAISMAGSSLTVAVNALALALKRLRLPGPGPAVPPPTRDSPTPAALNSEPARVTSPCTCRGSTTCRVHAELAARLASSSGRATHHGLDHGLRFPAASRARADRQYPRPPRGWSASARVWSSSATSGVVPVSESGVVRRCLPADVVADDADVVRAAVCKRRRRRERERDAARGPDRRRQTRAGSEPCPTTWWR